MTKEDYIIKEIIEKPELVFWQEKHLQVLFEVDKKEVQRCIAIARTEIGNNTEIMKRTKIEMLDLENLNSKEKLEKVSAYYPEFKEKYDYLTQAATSGADFNSAEGKLSE